MKEITNNNRVLNLFKMSQTKNKIHFNKWKLLFIKNEKVVLIYLRIRIIKIKYYDVLIIIFK